ncbi:MAG TPA: BTAD domain-containing putative transcriptional regulator [Micromonosporaceae bacterium]|nr:BTAD domain-containing putative transcriptional regulator [Micromonosporaceae bacterium]
MAEVTIRVLGPVEVQAPGHPAVSPAPAVRALLARLALTPGRVVSADALTDALWGEQLPADAANALQIRVSKLRRALSGAGLDGNVIATRAPGYLLTLPAEAVDAHRFEQAAARGRAAAVAGDSEAALAHYTAAMALWRGTALADLGDAEWVCAERIRLTELHLGVVEDRLELLLGAGHCGEAVADLERLVTEHPLRERLYRLLMLALYRTGRQADALAVHQRLRHRLADELGIDPSPELRALAEAILRQQVPGVSGPPPPREPTSAAPAAAPGSQPGPGTSGVVPRRLTSFVGRDADLRTVLEQLRPARVVTLTGPGGVGKTTLALEAARRIDATVADTVHIVRLAALPVDADVAEAFAGQLGISGSGPGAAAAEAVVEHLRNRRVLLVVDNCEHVVDAAAALVEELLQHTADVRVLATSREALAVSGETQIAVGPLAVPDEAAGPADVAQSAAVRLFLDRAHSARPEFALNAGNAAAITSICRQLDGMPLAIELAAARVKALPPAEIAARLRDRFSLLTGGPRNSDARHRTLRATIDWSHDLLSEAERHLLRRLAVFHGGWTLGAAEQVCGFGGIEHADVAELLFRLVDRSLVVADPATGRFRLLVTIREYALARLLDADEVDTCRRRHLAHYLAVAQEHGPLVRFAGPHWDRIAGEQDNLRAALDLCLQDPGDLDSGFGLATALVTFWSYGKRYEGVRALTALLERGGPDAVRAGALQGICRLHVYYPTPQSRAAGRESIALFGALGDDHNAAVSRLLVAWEGQYGGDTAEHRAMIEQARNVLGDAERGWWRAMTYYVEASVDLRGSDFDASARHWRRSLELLESAGDRMMAGAARAHLAIALRRLGRHHEAVPLLRQAAEESREQQSMHGYAFALVQLAHTMLDVGETADVPALLAQAEEVARQVRNPRNPAWAAWGRARLAMAGGDAATAADECRTAVDLLGDREFPWALAELWATYADAATAAGRPDEARHARAQLNGMSSA